MIRFQWKQSRIRTLGKVPYLSLLSCIHILNAGIRTLDQLHQFQWNVSDIGKSSLQLYGRCRGFELKGGQYTAIEYKRTFICPRWHSPKSPAFAGFFAICNWVPFSRNSPFFSNFFPIYASFLKNTVLGKAKYGAFSHGKSMAWQFTGSPKSMPVIVNQPSQRRCCQTPDRRPVWSDQPWGGHSVPWFAPVCGQAAFLSWVGSCLG